MYLKKNIIKLFFGEKHDFDFDGKYNADLVENFFSRSVGYDEKI